MRRVRARGAGGRPRGGRAGRLRRRRRGVNGGGEREAREPTQARVPRTQRSRHRTRPRLRLRVTFRRIRSGGDRYRWRRGRREETLRGTAGEARGEHRGPRVRGRAPGTKGLPLRQAGAGVPQGGRRGRPPRRAVRRIIHLDLAITKQPTPTSAIARGP